MSQVIISVFNTIGQASLIAIFFAWFLHPKFSKVLTIAAVLLSFALLEGLCLFMIFTPIQRVIAYPVVGWLLIRLLFYERGIRVISFAIRLIVIDLLAEVVAGLTYLLIVHLAINYIQIEVSLDIAIAFFNLYFMATMVLYWIYRHVEHPLARKRLFIATIVTTVYQATLLLAIFYSYVTGEQEMMHYGIFVFMAVFVQLYCVIGLIASIWPLLQKEKQSQLIYLQQSTQLEQYKQSKKSEEKMRYLKHDFANHLQTILALADQSEYTLVEKILRQMEHEYRQVETVYYCNNTIINSILTVKTDVAKGHGISVKSTIGPMDELPLSELFLCGILANLYDNAIEECVRLSNLEKWIEIKIGIQKNHLVIVFANPVETTVQKFLYTKKDNENHGNGLNIVKYLVGEFQGDMLIAQEKNIFEVTVTVMLSSDKQ